MHAQHYGKVWLIRVLLGDDIQKYCSRERERERENPCVRVALYPGKMFVATLSLFIPLI